MAEAFAVPELTPRERGSGFSRDLLAQTRRQSRMFTSLLVTRWCRPSESRRFRVGSRKCQKRTRVGDFAAFSSTCAHVEALCGDSLFLDGSPGISISWCRRDHAISCNYEKGAPIPSWQLMVDSTLSSHRLNMLNYSRFLPRLDLARVLPARTHHPRFPLGSEKGSLPGPEVSPGPAHFGETSLGCYPAPVPSDRTSTRPRRFTLTRSARHE